eukprot:g5746.t1
MEIQSTRGDSLNTKDTSSIMSFMLSSDDFQDISTQANATADSLIKHLSGANNHHPSTAISSPVSTQNRCVTKSIGIIDLDKEIAFGDEVLYHDQEREFLTNLLDNLSEIEGEQQIEKFNKIATESPVSSTAGSALDVSVITLELQSALRQAEGEISSLNSQVQSKTQHLELAQRALMDYEEEVQLLSQQLKELSELEEEDPSTSESVLKSPESPVGSSSVAPVPLLLSPKKKASCDNFVRELWRVKSGTHKIRKSLGEDSSTLLWSENSLPSSPVDGDDDDETKLKTEFENSKKRIEEWKECYERVEKQNKKLQKEQEECKQDLKTVAQELKETKNHLQNSKEETKRLEKEKTKLRAQLVQAEEELMCVLQETPDADEEVNTYRRRLKESQQQREVLLRDLDCARTELTSLKAEINLKQNLVTSKDSAAAIDESDQKQKTENKVMEVQEALDSKLRDFPDLLKTQSGGQDLQTQVHSLQEALNLALEANGLLEQRIEDQQENSSSVPLGLKIILEDINQLKENFQRERRIALHERTENENLIINLQQEKEELIHQVHQVTVGLNQLHEKTSRVENELSIKRATSEQYRIQAEHQIMNLRREKEAAFLRLAEMQETLDLSLEAKSVLESKLSLMTTHQLENRISELDHPPMEFIAVLRHTIQTGNEAQVVQAALQAIDQLEQLQVQFPSALTASESRRRFNDTALFDSVSETGAQMTPVTSQQLRILRNELREVMIQRDEALLALKAHKEKDIRRYNDIHALQTELNSALEQHEQLLPKFKEVLSSRRELELRVQSQTRDLRRQRETQQEIEDAVVSLLASCEHFLRDSGLESRGLSMPSLLDSILTIKSELEEISVTKSLSRSSLDTVNFPSRRTSVATELNGLRLMVDQERDLRNYFESQTCKLQRLKAEREPRSQSWSRVLLDRNQSRSSNNCPMTEFQLQEKMLITAKLQHKDQEISELFDELELTRSGDEEIMSSLLNTEEEEERGSYQGRMSRLQSAEDFGVRLNRLQECTEMIEQQLTTVKSENRGLKIERQNLMKRFESQSSSSTCSK